MPCNSVLLAATLGLLVTAYCPVDAGQDLTLTPLTSGTDVVEASVALVEESAIFLNDNQFLRRLAWVESQDGEMSNTYFGGIWQVDDSYLHATQDVTSNSSLTSVFKSVLVQFNIKWLSVQPEDLLKPLFSALAARIFLSTVSDPIPLASDIHGQGSYWKKHYRPNESVDTFVQLVQELENLQECHTRGMDLVFLLDSSGSIGPTNYDKVLNFVADIVSLLDIGPSATQIGLVIFGDYAQTQFHLNTYSDNVSVIQAVKNTTYLGGFTNTPDGLDTLIGEFNTSSFGVRLAEQGIPRVAIVVTDGKSNKGGGPNATIANAERVHDNNILTYAVGVGDSVNIDELNAIATSPEYVFLLADFLVSELQQLQEAINYQACKVPAIADVEDVFHGILQSDERIYFQFKLPSVGMTLKIKVDVGTVVAYISNKIRNPNEAIYDWKLETSTSVDVFISTEGLEINSLSSPIVTRRETMDTTDTDITIYVSVQGSAEKNNFILNTTYGDTTLPKEATGSTTATTATESDVTMVVVWSVIGGTLLVGLVILVITIIIVVLIKRSARRSERKSGGRHDRPFVPTEGESDAH